MCRVADCVKKKKNLHWSPFKFTAEPLSTCWWCSGTLLSRCGLSRSLFFASVHEGLARLVNHVMQWEAVRSVTLPSASVPSACWDTYISARPLWAWVVFWTDGVSGRCPWCWSSVLSSVCVFCLIYWADKLLTKRLFSCRVSGLAHFPIFVVFVRKSRSSEVFFCTCFSLMHQRVVAKWLALLHKRRKVWDWTHLRVKVLFLHVRTAVYSKWNLDCYIHCRCYVSIPEYSLALSLSF